MKNKILIEIELPSQLQENGIVVFDHKQKSYIVKPQSELTANLNNEIIKLNDKIKELENKNNHLSDIIVEMTNADDGEKL